MIPVARTEKLLIQEVGNELIVYDQENNTSHCLNLVAAKVYELCNGQHTIKDIAELLEKELNISKDDGIDTRGLVWLTLEELERFNLIKEYLKQPVSVSNISRRNVIKTGALVGGFAIGSMFPLVKSIIAPKPAMGKSFESIPPCKIEKGIGGTFLCVPNTCVKGCFFVDESPGVRSCVCGEGCESQKTFKTRKISLEFQKKFRCPSTCPSPCTPFCETKELDDGRVEVNCGCMR